MKLAWGKSIAASNALVAGVGACAMVSLVYLISGETPTVKTRVVHVSHEQPLSRQPVDRMAFASPHVFMGAPELRPGLDSDVPSPGILGDAATGETASWTTETAAPPWQTDLSAAPVPGPAPVARESGPSKAGDDDTPRRRRYYNRPLERRLAQIAPGAIARLKTKFEHAKVAWPPAEIALIGIKDEKILELHARSKGGPWELIHRYRVLAASGSAGPKLRQGDKQVPEGIYQIAWLNPNSAYHVSLRVSYPNAFDRKMARAEGRSNLGGDIMIHGKNRSAGCLAIGDEAVEEIFTVAAETGLAKVRVIIAPTDLRTKAFPEPKPGQPAWVPKLYTEIASAMSGYESVSPITTSSTNIASSFMSFFAK